MNLVKSSKIEVDMRLDFNNIGVVYSFFSKCGSKQSVEKCLQFLESNSRALLADESAFSKLPCKLIVELFSRESFHAREVDKCKSLVKWQQQNPSFEIKALFRCIRWTRIAYVHYMMHIKPLNVVTLEEYNKWNAEEDNVSLCDILEYLETVTSNKANNNISQSLVDSIKAPAVENVSESNGHPHDNLANGSTSSDVNDKHNSKPANILHNVDEMCKQTSIREKNTMWFLNNLSKYLNGMRKESQSGIGNVTKNRVNLRESEINKCSSSEKGNKQTSLRVTPETVIQPNNSISLQIAKQQKNEPANHANVPISIKKEKSAKESKILHNALTHVSSLAVEKSVIKHGCNSRTVIKVDSNYSFVTCEKSDDFKKIEIPLQKRKKRGVYNLDVVNSCIFIKVKDKFKLFACKICSREFTRIDWVRRHVATVHKKLRPFVCKTCGRRLTTSQSLSEHMMSLHNNNKRNYRCNVCGKRYKTRNHLYYHRTRVHEFSHACTCDVCGASYKSRPVMRRHFEKYHPNAVFNEAKVLNSITDVAPAK